MTTDLARELRVGNEPDSEVVEILGDILPMSSWDSGRAVRYNHPDVGHVLTVTYTRHGRIDAVQAAPGAPKALLERIIARANEVYDADLGSEIRRDILFTPRPTLGYWRYRDEWQILPAPPNAPRPDMLMAAHPVVLEYRIRASANFRTALTRRRSRLRELRLLLSLLIWGGVEGELESHPHRWVIEPTGLATYANEGYAPGEGFVAVGDDFTLAEGLYARLNAVPDDEYYSGSRGVDEVELPLSIDNVFDRFVAASPDVQERFLRASYWRDAAYRVWDESKSLSFLSAITAIEALFPNVTGRCPSCNRLLVGPNALFKEFVEKYAASEGSSRRAAMYALRSDIVHGTRLHALDAPRPWGALVPSAETDRDLHTIAFGVSRAVVVNWLLENSSRDD